MGGDTVPLGPSWDLLRIFIAVFRAGSFSAAADDLGVAQSSLSEQIARLERTLGYRLLDRSPAGVRVTARGAELAARIAPGIDALAAVTDFQGAKELHTVFLGGPAEFLSEVILPGITGGLTSSVRVATQFGLAEDLINELRSGAIDVLVSALPVRGTDLATEPIYNEEFALVTHPDWAQQATHNLDSIPILAYGHELPIIRRYWRSVLNRSPSTLNARVIAPDLRTLLHLCLDGAGMTVLPDYLIRAHLDSGALIQLYTPEIAPLNTLYIATRKPRGLPDPAVAALREVVIATARNFP